MAIVPDVLGIVPSSWCMPCVPIAGMQTGVFVVPTIGAKVWIEFEGTHYMESLLIVSRSFFLAKNAGFGFSSWNKAVKFPISLIICIRKL